MASWNYRNSPEGERSAGRFIRGMCVFLFLAGFLRIGFGIGSGDGLTILSGGLVVAVAAAVFVASWRHRWSETHRGRAHPPAR